MIELQMLLKQIHDPLTQQAFEGIWFAHTKLTFIWTIFWTMTKSWVKVAVVLLL
jgi:hypothetical protein